MLSKRLLDFLLRPGRFQPLETLVEAAIGLGMPFLPARLRKHAGISSKGDVLPPVWDTYQVGSFLLSLAYQGVVVYDRGLHSPLREQSAALGLP